MNSWLPKSVLCLKSYTKRLFLADLLSGITVGLVALPLAMAFAIASGVPPEAGLYCAIVAGFVISALGGSKTQIGGPTGAFVVVVFGIIAKYGVDGLFMSTLMAGILLLILGVTGLGTAVKFIPRPVVVGFTNGIAVIIASTQLKDFFGLKIDKVPGEFLARIQAVVHNFSSFSPIETTLATVALAVIILFMRYVKRVPGYIVALFLGTAAVLLFKLPVETIGTRFGGIPSGLPTLKVPHFHLDLLRPLISPAITVAMLGAIESLMSARAPCHRRHRENGDKHPFGGENSGIRNDSCPNSPGHRGLRSSPGKIHSVVGPGCDPFGRFLQHGRVEGNPGTFEALPNGDCDMAGHFPIDGVCGSYGGCRSRHDSRRAGFH